MDCVRSPLHNRFDVAPLDDMTDVEWYACLDGLACIHRTYDDVGLTQAHVVGGLAHEIMCSSDMWDDAMISWSCKRVTEGWGK